MSFPFAYNGMSDGLDDGRAGIKPDFDLSDPFAGASSMFDSDTSSISPSTSEGDDNADISVSTAFNPSAKLLPDPTDLILTSADVIFFYVHSEHLLSASSNSFNAHLPAQFSSQPIIRLPEPASVLNVVLHAVYSITVTAYGPSLDEITAAVDAMANYGFDVKRYVAPGTELAEFLLALAPLQPLNVYALASRHGLTDLAQRASPHLLSFSLTNISDEMAERTGAIPLKKLFFLHLGRVDALKRLLYSPPHPHGPTPQCDFAEQKKITRAWALASSYLLWNARPDLSVGAIESALKPLGDAMSCGLCKEALEKRVKEVVVQWAQVKRTI